MAAHLLIVDDLLRGRVERFIKFMGKIYKTGLYLTLKTKHLSKQRARANLFLEVPGGGKKENGRNSKVF